MHFSNKGSCERASTILFKNRCVSAQRNTHRCAQVRCLTYVAVRQRSASIYIWSLRTQMIIHNRAPGFLNSWVCTRGIANSFYLIYIYILLQWCSNNLNIYYKIMGPNDNFHTKIIIVLASLWYNALLISASSTPGTYIIWNYDATVKTTIVIPNNSTQFNDWKNARIWL